MYRICKIILLGIILQIITAQFVKQEKLIKFNIATIKRKDSQVLNETLKEEDKGLFKIISNYMNRKENLDNLKIRDVLTNLDLNCTVIWFADSLEILRNYQNLLKLEQSKLVITKTVKWQLRDLLSDSILNIVLWEHDHLKLDLLNMPLNRRHLKKLLFVIPEETLKPYKQWLDLLQWLHKEGFWNTLLMDSGGNTLAMDHLTGELLKNSLDIQEFLLAKSNWWDLKGYPIHVSIANNPPRSLLYRNKNNDILLKGYYGSLITMFANYYNATLITHQVSELDYYREMDCLLYLQEEFGIDLCADAMAWNLYSTVTVPEELALSYLLVPYDKPLSSIRYFFKPFRKEVWILIVFSLVYNTFALALIHRLQHKTWLITLHFVYTLSALMNLPFNLKKVKGFWRKYLELLFIILGFMVSNWYLSLLTSIFYTRLYSQDINSLKDLQLHNISIMVNDAEYLLLKTLHSTETLLQQLLVVSNDILHQNRRNLNPQYAYFSQYDKNDFYLYQQKFLLKPRMKQLLQVPLHNILAGIPMRINWPFEHLLNKFFGLVMQTGLSQRLLIETYEDGIRSGYLEYFPTEYLYVEPLILEYFQLSAFVLIAGYLLGFITFLWEIVYFKRVTK